MNWMDMNIRISMAFQPCLIQEALHQWMADWSRKTDNWLKNSRTKEQSEACGVNTIRQIIINKNQQWNYIDIKRVLRRYRTSPWLKILSFIVQNNWNETSWPWERERESARILLKKWDIIIRALYHQSESPLEENIEQVLFKFPSNYGARELSYSVILLI